jgi:hypothetical protein
MSLLDDLFGGKITMKAFWASLAHATIGGAATGVVTAGAGVTGMKQIGIIAASSALTSVLSLFTPKPTTVALPPAPVSNDPFLR